MQKLTLLLALACLSGCAGAKPRTDIDPNDPDSSKLCAAAATTLDKLNCKERMTPAGKPFAQFCLEKRASSPPALPLEGVRCVSQITSCTEIDPCWD